MANICSVNDCGKPAHGSGYCEKHYRRWRKRGDPNFVWQKDVCSIDGCDRKHSGHGYCGAHYLRWRKYGDPLGGGRPLSAKGAPLAWMREHLTYASDECLFWPFARHPNGYGSMNNENGDRVGTHRWVCAQINGEPPTPEHQAAHSCGKGRQGCVNGKHLRWATPLENSADKKHHGTTGLGKPGPHKTLTESQVRQIRALRGKVSQTKLAKQFGVSQTNVGAIQRTKIWRWLD